MSTTTSKTDGVSANLSNVTVATQANVYFDGKCVSHSVTFADGTKKSVGVILPATLTFNTGAPEIMECTGGSCEYRLAGSDAWVKSSPGDKFSIAGNSKFDIRVSESYHYICHFG
jgi:purine/pyrimidine-nucleoside phosphorylase